MQLVERLDDYGKAAWITAMILGFIVFWPIGLGILAYMIGSGRMACWNYRGRGRWHFFSADEGRSGRRRHRRRRHGSPVTGNRAFDEYREETLRRLEDERREFEDFLENLRHAKDKAEFDQFMAAERKAGPKATNDSTGSLGPEGPAPQPAG